MVRISAETILRANERTIAKYRSGCHSAVSTDGVKMETSINGHTYSLNLSERRINDAFRRALENHNLKPTKQN